MKRQGNRKERERARKSEEEYEEEYEAEKSGGQEFMNAKKKCKGTLEEGG